MRRRRISPFDLRGAINWRRKQQRIAEKPEEYEKGGVRLVRESVGKGTENRLIVATESMIKKEPAPGIEVQLDDRECYAGG